MYEMNNFLCCRKILLPCRQQLQMPWIKQKSLSHVKEAHKNENKGLPCTILYGCHQKKGKKENLVKRSVINFGLADYGQTEIPKMQNNLVHTYEQL